MSDLYFWVCTQCGKRTISYHRPNPGKCPGSPDQRRADFERLADSFATNKKYKRRTLPPHRWVKDGIATEAEYQEFLEREHRATVRGRIGCFLIVLLIIAIVVFNNYRSDSAGHSDSRENSGVQQKSFETNTNDNTVIPDKNGEPVNEGIYAVYNLGDFRNYGEGVFYCYGDYCKNIDEKTLTKEDMNFIKHSAVRGSVKIEFNKAQNSYQAIGGFIVENACSLTTGSLTAPTLCARSKNSITCDFHDVLNDQTLSLIFTVADTKLNVSIDPHSSIKNKINTTTCINRIKETSIKYESYEDYKRILRLSTKLGFIKANADILSVWKSLSADTRKQILPEQRKWIKEKDAKCGKADMKGSVKEISAMQECHIVMTQQRINILKSLE